MTLYCLWLFRRTLIQTAKKITYIHFFSHFLLCLFSYLRIYQQLEYLIIYIKNELEEKVHELFPLLINL